MDSERDAFLPFPAQTSKLGPTSFLLNAARRNTRVVLIAGLASTFLFSSLLYGSDVPRAALNSLSSSFSYGGSREPWPTQCSPDDWSDGEWVRKPPAEYPLEHYLSLYPYNASAPVQPKLSPTADVARHPLAPLGFLGCASGRERAWHLAIEEDGTPDKNHPDLWGYVVRGASYDWVPKNTACRRYSERVGREQFVRSLVERGGWFLVGGELRHVRFGFLRDANGLVDSVTEQQFFSMSCMLYPHVIATPDYAPHGGSGPRDWPQHLYRMSLLSPFIHTC